MEPHRRRQLIKIRNSFVERYKIAKQFGDKFYTEYFKRQIKDIDKELEENNFYGKRNNLRQNIGRI